MASTYLQTFTPDVTLLALVGVVVTVVTVGVIILLAVRRRPQSRFGSQPVHQPPVLLQHPQPTAEMSPTVTVLEMLKRDLEEAAAAHSSGALTGTELNSKVSEIRKTLEDLRQFREVAPKSKSCSGCGAEITGEAKFCDRCGAKQQ